jgi:serine/threonine protein kinase
VIKCIKIENMNENLMRDAMQEAKILEVCNHPNIPRYIEIYRT